MKKLVLLLLIGVFVVSLSAVTIYDIQYTENAGPDGTYPSPMADQDVTIQGIVTGAGYAGDKFFVCDLPEEGVGAWHGIYIYNVDPEQAPQLGDMVEISGTVSEYYGVTELGYVTVEVLSSGHDIPAPVEVSTLNLVIPAQAEQYEGCLVSISEVEVVEAQNDYGEWYVTDGEGDCQIDDGFFYLDEVDPPIEIEVGQTWYQITGILDYSYDEYGLNPRTPDDLQSESNSENDIIENDIISLNNYPNPFNPETTIKFNLNKSARTSIEIYNINGQKVKTLIDEYVDAGNHTATWNGRDNDGNEVASGVYFYKLKSGRYTTTKKMILMK